MDNSRRREMRHCYNIQSFTRKIPSKEIPNFEELVGGVAEEFRRLASLVLQIIAVALGKEYQWAWVCWAHWRSCVGISKTLFVELLYTHLIVSQPPFLHAKYLTILIKLMPWLSNWYWSHRPSVIILTWHNKCDDFSIQ